MGNKQTKLDENKINLQIVQNENNVHNKHNKQNEHEESKAKVSKENKKNNASNYKLSQISHTDKIKSSEPNKEIKNDYNTNDNYHNNDKNHTSNNNNTNNTNNNTNNTNNTNNSNNTNNTKNTNIINNTIQSELTPADYFQHYLVSSVVKLNKQKETSQLNINYKKEEIIESLENINNINNSIETAKGLMTEIMQEENMIASIDIIIPIIKFLLGNAYNLFPSSETKAKDSESNFCVDDIREEIHTFIFASTRFEILTEEFSKLRSLFSESIIKNYENFGVSANCNLENLVNKQLEQKLNYNSFSESTLKSRIKLLCIEANLDVNLNENRFFNRIKKKSMLKLLEIIPIYYLDDESLNEIHNRKFLSCLHKFNKSVYVTKNITRHSKPSLIDKNFKIVIKINQNQIASGGANILIWNLLTGKCIKILSNCKSYITSLILFRYNCLISGGCIGEILLWDMSLRKTIKSLKSKEFENHKLGVCKILKLNNNQIISEYSNNIVIIWDVNEGQEIKKIDCNLSYAKLGSIINIGSTHLTMIEKSLTSIIIIDITDIESISQKILSGHLPNTIITGLIVLTQKQIVTSSEDQTLKIWDVTKEKCLKTLTGHTDIICSLTKLNRNKIASGEKFVIKIWNTISRNCLKTIKIKNYDIQINQYYSLVKINEEFIAQVEKEAITFISI